MRQRQAPLKTVPVPPHWSLAVLQSGFHWGQVDVKQNALIFHLLAFQIFFSWLGYPGISLGPHLHLSMFNAPALFGSFLNICNMVFLLKMFREGTAGILVEKTNNKKVKFLKESWKKNFWRMAIPMASWNCHHLTNLQSGFATWSVSHNNSSSQIWRRTDSLIFLMKFCFQHWLFLCHAHVSVDTQTGGCLWSNGPFSTGNGCTVCVCCLHCVWSRQTVNFYFINFT